MKEDRRRGRRNPQPLYGERGSNRFWRSAGVYTPACVFLRNIGVLLVFTLTHLCFVFICAVGMADAAKWS